MDRGLAAAGQTDVRFGRRVSRPRRGLGRPLRVPQAASARPRGGAHRLRRRRPRGSAAAYPSPTISSSSARAEFLSSSTDSGTFGSTISASPTRPSPSRSSVSTALIRAPWSGTEISWRKPLPHSGQVQVAQRLAGRAGRGLEQHAADRLDLLGGSQSAKAGLTPDGAFGARRGERERLGLRDRRGHAGGRCAALSAGRSRRSLTPAHPPVRRGRRSTRLTWRPTDRDHRCEASRHRATKRES